MIEIKFYKPGTIVYSILYNKITPMEVVDVHIDSKEFTIHYSLKKDKRTFKMFSKDLFDSLESLKECIDKQFDELIPKDIEEDTGNTEETKA